MVTFAVPSSGAPGFAIALCRVPTGLWFRLFQLQGLQEFMNKRTNSDPKEVVLTTLKTKVQLRQRRFWQPNQSVPSSIPPEWSVDATIEAQKENLVPSLHSSADTLSPDELSSVSPHGS